MDLTLGFGVASAFIALWIALFIAIIVLTIYGGVVTYKLTQFYAQQQSPEQADLIAVVVTVASVVFGVAPVVGVVGIVLHLSGNLPYAQQRR